MRIFFAVSAMTFLFSFCQNTPKTIQKDSTLGNLPSSFLDFYQKFHTDTVYQMAHIQWPLKGQKVSPTDSTMTPQLYEWTRAEWAPMQMPDTTMSTLKRTYEMVGEVLVIEKMSYPMIGFGYERQFYEEEDGQWYLIYYGEAPMRN